jgi:hypothetical protein
MQPPYHSTFKTRPGGRLGPRPRFQVLTGSLGRPGQFFFLNQNGVVLVKKKQKSAGLQLGLDWVLPGQPAGSAGSHHVFSSPIFSSTWPDSSPGSTRWAGPGFKTMLCTNYNYLLRAYNNFYTRKTKIKRQE